MGYRYIINTVSGRIDAVNKLPGSGTTPVGKKPFTYTSTGGDDNVTHSGLANPIDIKMESPVLTEINILINEIRTDYEAHRIDVVGGYHAGADNVNAITQPVASDWTTLLALYSDIYTQYTAHLADALLVGPVFHQATGTDYSLTGVAVPTTPTEVITGLNDMKAKFNSHDSDAVAHTGGGSHQITSADSIEYYEDIYWSWKELDSDPTNVVVITSADIRYVKGNVIF